MTERGILDLVDEYKPGDKYWIIEEDPEQVECSCKKMRIREEALDLDFVCSRCKGNGWYWVDYKRVVECEVDHVTFMLAENGFERNDVWFMYEGDLFNFELDKVWKTREEAEAEAALAKEE